MDACKAVTWLLLSFFVLLFVAPYVMWAAFRPELPLNIVLYGITCIGLFVVIVLYCLTSDAGRSRRSVNRQVALTLFVAFATDFCYFSAGVVHASAVVHGQILRQILQTLGSPLWVSRTYMYHRTMVQRLKLLPDPKNRVRKLSKINDTSGIMFFACCVPDIFTIYTSSGYWKHSISSLFWIWSIGGWCIFNFGSASISMMLGLLVRKLVSASVAQGLAIANDSSNHEVCPLLRRIGRLANITAFACVAESIAELALCVTEFLVLVTQKSLSEPLEHARSLITPLIFALPVVIECYVLICFIKATTELAASSADVLQDPWQNGSTNCSASMLESLCVEVVVAEDANFERVIQELDALDDATLQRTAETLLRLMLGGRGGALLIIQDPTRVSLSMSSVDQGKFGACFRQYGRRLDKDEQNIAALLNAFRKHTNSDRWELSLLQELTMKLPGNDLYGLLASTNALPEALGCLIGEPKDGACVFTPKGVLVAAAQKVRNPVHHLEMLKPNNQGVGSRHLAGLGIVDALCKAWQHDQKAAAPGAVVVASDNGSISLMLPSKVGVPKILQIG